MIQVDLLPTVDCTREELADLCVRLQALGICAIVGHSGPYGSMHIARAAEPERMITNARLSLEQITAGSL